jgi:hypothetical protein
MPAELKDKPTTHDNTRAGAQNAARYLDTSYALQNNRRDITAQPPPKYLSDWQFPDSSDTTFWRGF